MSTKNTSKKTIKDQVNTDANISLVSGGILGALGMAEAVTLGIICPACVVGACGFVGYGIYKKIKNNNEHITTPKN